MDIRLSKARFSVVLSLTSLFQTVVLERKFCINNNPKYLSNDDIQEMQKNPMNLPFFLWMKEIARS